MQYLSKEELKAQCPVAFATKPTNDAVTDKYVHISTEKVIDDLEKLGWLPVQATQRKSRGKKTIFSKHMIQFQNPDIKVTASDGDNAYPRILLTNSHDGMTSFQFRVGIFRLVCSNGLVIATDEFESFKIRHKGYTFEELRSVVMQAVEDLPNRVEVMNKMTQRELSEEEQRKLALDALLIRSGITPGSKEAKEKDYDEETLDEILEARRPADEGDDLWKVFNRVQEAVTQGGFSAALKGAKVRKVRKIKSFEKDTKVNQELFKLATALI
jgi:hypothetical protein